VWEIKPRGLELPTSAPSEACPRAAPARSPPAVSPQPRLVQDQLAVTLRAVPARLPPVASLQPHLVAAMLVAVRVVQALLHIAAAIPACVTGLTVAVRVGPERHFKVVFFRALQTR
jgi:hypothetical protein